MARRSTNRRPTSKRKLVWARTQTSVTVPTAASPAFAAPARVDVLAQFVNAYGASLIGATVVRVRGVMGNQLQQAGAASITACMYIGDANDIVRGPNANDNYYDSNSRGKDYFLVEPFVFANTAQTCLFGSDVVARVIDVKSSRKLEEVSQRLVLDVSGFSAAVTAQPFFADLSILLMLP